MNITHFVQGLGLGGAEAFVVDLVEAQRSLGADVDLMLVGPPNPAERSLTVDAERLRRRSWPEVSCVMRARSHLLKRNTDVAHLHTFSGLLYGGLGSLIARTSTVFTEHASSSPKGHYGRRQWAADVLARRSDAVVTFNQELRRVIIKRSHLDPARVEVIPNGIQLDLPSRVSRADARRLLEVADHSVAVVAVGGLRPQKNYEMLMELARYLMDRGDLVSLPEIRIIGDGTERGRLEQLIAELGVVNVRLLGARQGARELLVGADIFVNTSRWEGMPVAVLEAMGAGLPIIATRSGSLPEVLGDAGLLIDHEVGSLAGALGALLEDPHLRLDLGRRAKEKVRADYDITNIAERHLELYARTLYRRRMER